MIRRETWYLPSATAGSEPFAPSVFAGRAEASLRPVSSPAARPADD